ncbi:response regulator transcription factor [Oceanospirillum sediminis]|uniref:LuxR family transcriptional regulator n=1 Tax=Oceanospirillum sediminis TaxID=2760088 RepID=A0A839ISK3_9GAMM|nr:helix-turn-helix transcriptional regulator [Oceanospirillum sediminis]MBB1487644.1 LuxR family transcriptional regulator [Oceanospirillum sediminis]
MSDQLLPHQFQHQSLSLINSVVTLSGSVFFLTEPDMRHKGAVLYNLQPSIEKEYTATYASLDPLNPQRFADKDLTVVTLDSQMSPYMLRQTLYYQEFMQPYNHRYVADMFFRQDGDIVAVLSMLRTDKLGAFTSDELSLLRKLQPFMEYSLNSVYLPERNRQREQISNRYQLTSRELDTLELVISGASNKAIASHLGLGLATVKTHLHHIFQKTGASSRSELVARMLQEI